ncbi:MAG: 4-aminobutyrate--2-oxoglutarate transaminase [Verrucomicrobia bacterium]|nr:4-aminobutyrate--2-oxoglutarate transaminase [Verrucomicrobiota bacterium]
MRSILLRTRIPGPNSQRLLRERERQIPRAVFQVAPVFVAHAHGAVVEDVDGNCFIDFAGGLGALNAGHTPLAVVEAVKHQADKFLHTCFHVAMHKPYVDLARKLNAITPGTHAKKTFFVNSGAEAVENAVKIARCFTKRPAIVCFEHGYHGRTLLTMSLTSKVKPYKFGFGPFAPEIYRLPYPYTYRRPAGMSEKSFVDACLAHTRDFFKTVVAPESVAAVVLELVTGEGGFIVMPRDYARGLAEICGEHKILMIVDEVQTGLGRTGLMFACEHYDLVPDLMTTAKSLAAGLPLAAVTGRAEIMESVHVGGLGGTFGGNPVACAAAIAAIQAIESDHLRARAREIGAQVMQRLNALQKRCRWIGEVRGLGAMIGVELVKSRARKEPHTELAARVVKGCAERGLLILSAGVHSNVIRTLMPLCITHAQVEEGLDVLASVLREGI